MWSYLRVDRDLKKKKKTGIRVKLSVLINCAEEPSDSLLTEYVIHPATCGLDRERNERFRVGTVLTNISCLEALPFGVIYVYNSDDLHVHMVL